MAAIFTVMHHRSHAHVILENFLEPYLFNGKRTEPGVEVVSFYADQRPAGDMAQEVSRQYRIPIFKTIDEVALPWAASDLPSMPCSQSASTDNTP